MAETTSPTWMLVSRLSLMVPLMVNCPWPATTSKGWLLAAAVSASSKVRTTPSTVLRTVEFSRATLDFSKSSSACFTFSSRSLIFWRWSWMSFCSSSLV